MKIFMVGEPASHAADLSASLRSPATIVKLPSQAAYESAWDEVIGPDDVVVALAFSRPNQACPPFRLLHVAGAGTDRIDLSCLPAQVRVCNVYEHEVPIAEYVLLCMLENATGAAQLRARLTATNWSAAYRSRAPHSEISGTTVGLIGYGRIGREVARRAQAFGVRVVAVNGRAVNPPEAEVRSSHHIDWLLEQADYVVVCCPLTNDTHGLLDQRRLSRMQSHAVLINPSRAEIVDEAALYAALSQGRIAGAYLDVWYQYPSEGRDVTPSRLGLLELPNVYGTPHSAAWTRQLFERRYAAIARNIDRLSSGEALQNELSRL